MKLGINFFGPIYSEDGIGEAARSTLKSFLAANIDVAINPLPRPTAREVGSAQINPGSLNTPYYINYFHFSSRWVPYYLELLGEKVLQNHYNISHWLCEVIDYPEEWAVNFKYFQEIWTASSFCQEAISRLSPVPVLKIPYPIFLFDNHGYTRKDLNLDDNKFLFLSIANAYSDIERKNILGTIRAFKEAFPSEDNVGLVLKLCNTNVEVDYFNRIKELINNDSRIQIIDEFLDREVISSLYHLTDAYVSLHRAEGFGLTMAEAMLAKKPVLTTGYSGNLDFCDYFNCFIVDFDLVRVGENRMRYKSENIWAEPKIPSAAEGYKEIFRNKALRDQKANLAFNRISNDFNEAKIGQLISKRLQTIENRFTWNLHQECMTHKHQFKIED